MIDTSVSQYMATLGQAARAAAVQLAKAPTKAKNAALVAIAERITASAEAMGLEKSKVGYFTFVGGFTGFTSGMTMIWYMNKFDYGLVVGGKPLFTPLFAFPVSYELTILLSAFATLGGMLLLNRLPKLYNPLFSSEIFKRASNDRFFICIEAADPKYAEARALLEASGASAIELVED
jgi:hypothetical protein